MFVVAAALLARDTLNEAKRQRKSRTKSLKQQSKQLINITKLATLFVIHNHGSFVCKFFRHQCAALLDGVVYKWLDGHSIVVRSMMKLSANRSRRARALLVPSYTRQLRIGGFSHRDPPYGSQ
jgi:hypothetical protein